MREPRHELAHFHLHPGRAGLDPAIIWKMRTRKWLSVIYTPSVSRFRPWLENRIWADPATCRRAHVAHGRSPRLPSLHRHPCLGVIYLDHNATTPVLPQVRDAMLPYLEAEWGNPSSIYQLGRAAYRAIEDARRKVAALVDAEPEQVVFTSGATEANNAALHSAVFRDPAKRHVVTSAVEHSAVLAYCDYLERVHGVEITRLPVNAEGALDPDDLRQAIRNYTAVVSLMWANNETGVIWPMLELASVCTDAGVPLHTDAVQAVGKIPVSFRNAGLDFLTLSAHKIGGPKGVGALVVRDSESFLPLIHGGKQEAGRRGGTENVAQIVGLGKAAEIAMNQAFQCWGPIATLRDDFESAVMARIKGAQINGGRFARLPNTSNLYLPGLDGDAVVTFLDQQGICISSGSACLESAIAPSHVLLAMNGSHEQASESIRVSLGQESTVGELEQLLTALEAFVAANV